MGQVFEALDHELGMPVALKVVRPDFASNPQAVDRFKAEVQMARRVTHQNVCRIFDLFVHLENVSADWGASDHQTLALTMELLRGTTLDQYLAEEGPLDIDSAASVVRQLCAALSAAHGVGVAHGDLKPGNVMLVPGPEPDSLPKAVITDFGLARPDDGGGIAARPRGFAGTLGYAAPEIVAGAAANELADLYALGVLMYEIVTGELPFGRDSGSASAPARLSELPTTWQSTIERCLATDPQERFAAAREIAGALEAPSGGRQAVLKLATSLADLLDRSTELGRRWFRRKKGH